MKNSAFILSFTILYLLSTAACEERKELDYTNIKGTNIEWDFPESWKKPSSTELKTKLTPIQYEVTQHEGTEPPYKNEYWNKKEEGIYVDIVSGEPLFSSLDKYDSGTGWPSFTKPLQTKFIEYKTDSSYGMTRVEVRSKIGGSHLGHVFEDGPAPSGLRYCMNSASLRFIPKERLKEEGYEKFLILFASSKK